MIQEAKAPSPGRQSAVMILAVASQATISICNWGLAAIAPDLARQYHLSAGGLGWVIAAQSVGTATTLVPAGVLVDRLGPRKPLILGGIASGASLVAAGLAPTTAWLVAAFFVCGAISSVVIVAGAVAVFATVDVARRGLAMGLRQMAVALGGLIAAGLLPLITVARGPGTSLIVSGGLAAAAAVAFGMLGSGEPATTVRAPLDVPELVRVPGMVRLLWTGAMYVVALTTVLSFGVPALRAQGASVAQGSALFTVIAVTAMLARILWGRLCDRRGPGRRWSVLTQDGVVIVVGALAYWAVAPWGPRWQIPVMAVFAFGALGVNGVVHLIGGELVGSDRTGQAMGLTQTVLFGVSGLVAPGLGLLADGFGYRSLWLIAALMGVAMVISAGRPRQACESG